MLTRLSAQRGNQFRPQGASQLGAGNGCGSPMKPILPLFFRILRVALALHQFATCLFCIKVRHEMRRLSLLIEMRDAQRDGPHHQTRLDGIGATKLPCLQIDSQTIITDLRGRFA